MKRQEQLFFGPKNADVTNNLKYFIPDHLNFLDDEDKAVCLETVEPKY